VLALLWPVIVVSFLVIIIGSYILTDGIISLMSAIKKRKTNNWDQPFVSGLISIFAGILTFFNPFIVAVIIVFFLFG
jgi:uncharacterized membrane protein HdeD (DUF308 family)